MDSFKLLFVTILIVQSVTAAEIIKECHVNLTLPDIELVVPTEFKVQNNSGKFIAKTIQKLEGEDKFLFDESVEISNYSVRGNLSRNMPNLNLAEQLVLGTIEYLADPETGAGFSLAIDLTAIRLAKIYKIGSGPDQSVVTAIVEAKDANEGDLGSFLTGLIPFKCL